MTDMEAVYKYGSPRGEVVARHEVEPNTHIPGVGETITLSDSSGEGRYVVTSRFPPDTASLESEGIVSTYTIVVENAYR